MNWFWDDKLLQESFWEAQFSRDYTFVKTEKFGKVWEHLVMNVCMISPRGTRQVIIIHSLCSVAVFSETHCKICAGKSNFSPVRESLLIFWIIHKFQLVCESLSPLTRRTLSSKFLGNHLLVTYTEAYLGTYTKRLRQCITKIKWQHLRIIHSFPIIRKRFFFFLCPNLCTSRFFLEPFRAKCTFQLIDGFVLNRFIISAGHVGNKTAKFTANMYSRSKLPHRFGNAEHNRNKILLFVLQMLTVSIQSLSLKFVNRVLKICIYLILTKTTI